MYFGSGVNTHANRGTTGGTGEDARDVLGYTNTAFSE